MGIYDVSQYKQQKRLLAKMQPTDFQISIDKQTVLTLF